MIKKPSFIPLNFNLPLKLETSEFLLRPLTVNDCQKDFEAVKNSLDYRGGEDLAVKSLTLEQNLINLQRHQNEFNLKQAFTYTVFSLDQTTCLGCIYIIPPTRGDYDAEVWLWVRKELIDKLDQKLFRTVKKWLNEYWPFKKVAYPGREIDWNTWDRQTQLKVKN